MRISDWSSDVCSSDLLENLVRRLAVLYSQETIDRDVIENELNEGKTAGHMAAPPSDSLGSAVEHHLRSYFAAHEDGLPASGLYDRILREVERPLIELSLAATKGNQIRAAKLLGVNRNPLRKNIRDLDIQVLQIGRTSELQSLMRISYAVFCLKKKISTQ